MNKNTVLAIAAAVIISSIVYLEASKPDFEPAVPQEIVSAENSQYPLAPNFAGIHDWINSEPLSLNDLHQEGKIVLVDFWTYSCINCIRTLPYLKSWHEKYSDKGLVIVGVHSPEFNFEKKLENVQMAVDKFGIGYAVALDNDHATWNAYQNRYWPRKYLVDKDGRIRYDHIGEGAYEETERKIQDLLAEAGENVSGMPGTKENQTTRRQITPELYAGYEFARAELGNPEGFRPGQIVDYTLPDSAPLHRITLEGRWKNNADDMELVGETGKIVLPFIAKTVNIVADSHPEKELKVVLDGAEIKTPMVKDPQLYEAVMEDHQYGEGLLVLEARKGFSFNSFTFGS